MKKTTSGFTIIELLVVVVVISILASITVVAFNGVLQRARDAERKTELSNLQKALELFYAERGGYPICGSSTPYTPGGALSASTVTGCLTTALVPTYIPSIPTDPTNSGSYRYFYGVGYQKTGPTSYAGNASNNYMMGNKLETVTSPTYSGWGPTDLTYLIGSAN